MLIVLSYNELEVVLADWNYWTQPPKNTVLRELLTKLPPLRPDLVLVVQGVRRCGKSTLLAQLMTQLQLDSHDCFFVNFEDPRLSDNLNHTLLDLLQNYARQKRPQAQARFFFFDEIQNVENWQKWLHTKMERPSSDCFVITGSNAALLSGDLSSALTGRHTTLELFPFSFAEFKVAKPEAIFQDYLAQGGFPRVVTYPEPQSLLREYFTDIIERDVRRHVAARSTQSLVQLVKSVFESTGSEISQRTLAGMLGVSVDTIGTYLAACEAAYMILPCPYFTFSERQRTARNKKYYPIDLGLRNAIITKTGNDLGKSLETIVFLALRKKYKNVYYWRKKGEVDFVVMGENGLLPIQVSWEEMKPRHEAALKEFYGEFPQAGTALKITKENIMEFLAGEI